MLAAGCGGAAGPRDVDVSAEAGSQFETRIAVDPASPDVLVAAAMGQGTAVSRMHVYGSIDGGAHWRATVLPAIPGNCAWDPTVAVAPGHEQYFAYARLLRCSPQRGTGEGGSAAIFVATRAGPGRPWREPAQPAVALTGPRFDDRPALGVDPDTRRVYLAWVDYKDFLVPVRVSHSDDSGVTWSPPVAAGRPGANTATSLAVGGDSELYVGWEDALGQRIVVTASRDGGRTFAPEQIVADTVESDGGYCGSAIPAQGAHQNGAGCVRPVPTLVADPGRRRVYDVWAEVGSDGTQDVVIQAMDTALRLVGPARKVSREHGDQFLPAAALDASTGRLWVCFYDTAGDPTRIHTRYSCAHSDDGGRSFSAPRRAATAASNERVPGATFYGDYTGVASAGGIAHPIWTDSRDLRRRGEEIYTAAIR